MLAGERARVISVHQSSDGQLGIYFAQGLEQADLTSAAPIVSAEADDATRIVRVTMALQNVADWKLRSQIHEVAMRVEDQHNLTVLCYFRPNDPFPFPFDAERGR
jgi:hypothetical protein